MTHGLAKRFSQRALTALQAHAVLHAGRLDGVGAANLTAWGWCPGGWGLLPTCSPIALVSQCPQSPDTPGPRHSEKDSVTRALKGLSPGGA